MDDTRERLRQQFIEHAQGVARLADQVTDRRVQITLIGLAFTLLDSMEAENRSVEGTAASAPSAVPTGLPEQTSLRGHHPQVLRISDWTPSRQQPQAGGVRAPQT